jgi:hypothetical protein
MKMPRQQIEPLRLIDASLAVLRAVAELSGPGEEVDVRRLMASGKPPSYLAGYATWEVEEAAAFLVRLGYLQPPKARRKAG